ncbi:calcium-binding protein, partial [Cysteiniphilum halobium]|uniref:calcium-binding protein n=1 Tax=Cysteiniphilum halobium TaxID=2219059 RepID=UPI003F86311F
MSNKVYTVTIISDGLLGGEPKGYHTWLKISDGTKDGTIIYSYGKREGAIDGNIITGISGAIRPKGETLERELASSRYEGYITEAQYLAMQSKGDYIVDNPPLYRIYPYGYSDNCVEVASEILAAAGINILKGFTTPTAVIGQIEILNDISDHNDVFINPNSYQNYMQQRLLSDLLSSEPRYAGDIAKQLSILSTEEYFNGVNRLTMGGPEGLHSINYADILSTLSELIRSDMSIIAKADTLLSNLLEQISGNKNITAQEFNYLYNQMLSVEGITFSGLLAARDRLSDFKNIFGQFDDVEDILSKDLKELEHLLDRVRDSGLVDSLINSDFTAAANAVPLRADPLIFDLDGDGIETVTADALYGEAGDDVLHGGGSNNILAGGEGNDVIVARAGNNKVFGGDGNDIIISGAMLSEVYNSITDGGVSGEKFLANSYTITEAGKGNDIIVSGYRNQSTYIYHLGDGHDVILKNAFLDAQGRIGFNYDGTYIVDYLFSDKDKGAINDIFNDVLRFSAGITPETISLKRIEYDLQLTINEHDSVRLTNFYKALDDYVDLGKVSRIEFASGTVWQRGDEVFNIAPENVHYVGTDQADSFHGTIVNDILEGISGSDHLYGAKGDDKIFGGEGDDRLYGNDGDDILNGGQGNDLLVGGHGNNRYIFGINSGRDEIQVTHLYSSGQFVNDTIVFTDGIMLDDVFFVKNLDDLIVKHANNQDEIMLKNFYTTTANYRSGVNQFIFADDAIVDRSHRLLDPATVRGTPYDDKLIGSNENDLMYGQDGNDNLEGNAGDDTLDGGLGNDRLIAGAGNDTLIGGKGNDYLYGETGHNRYVFSAMDGEDKVKKVDLSRQITGNSSTLVFNEGIQLSDFNQINLTSFSQLHSKLGERYLKWHIKDLIFISEKKGLNITLVDYGMTKDYDEDKRDYSSSTYLEFNNGTERWQLTPHKAMSMEVNGGERTFHNSVTLIRFDEVEQVNYIQGIGKREYLQGTEG